MTVWSRATGAPRWDGANAIAGTPTLVVTAVTVTLAWIVRLRPTAVTAAVTAVSATVVVTRHARVTSTALAASVQVT